MTTMTAEELALHSGDHIKQFSTRVINSGLVHQVIAESYTGQIAVLRDNYAFAPPGTIAATLYKDRATFENDDTQWHRIMFISDAASCDEFLAQINK
ncbi:hypothetical protein QPX54_09865 [Corynebacterium propinquum]|uniref:Uncharacterized protein n=1 Tax=Corynebacterium propinquum TaxID=43769 RepID=A0AAP4BWD0_9CORY|nr:hypothetical protein [Corynebacterium propinquum]MDK4326806.1 hypothetical protein [Corynebacterium propinquum]